MKQILIILVSLSYPFFLFGQEAKFDSILAMANLKSASQKMRQCIVDKDFTGFTNFVYPQLIKMVGGKDKMAELTKNSFTGLEEQGFVFSNIIIEDPVTIISSENKLQSVIQENLTIKTKEGHLAGKSYLIAISENGGRTWSFVETSGKTLEQMQALFSFLSNKLIIPKKEQLLFYKD